MSTNQKKKKFNLLTRLNEKSQAHLETPKKTIWQKLNDARERQNQRRKEEEQRKKRQK